MLGLVRIAFQFYLLDSGEVLTWELTKLYDDNFQFYLLDSRYRIWVILWTSPKLLSILFIRFFMRTCKNLWNTAGKLSILFIRFHWKNHLYIPRSIYCNLQKLSILFIRFLTSIDLRVDAPLVLFQFCLLDSWAGG